MRDANGNGTSLIRYSGNKIPIVLYSINHINLIDFLQSTHVDSTAELF